MLQTQPLAPPVGVELLGFELSRGIEESDARVLRQLLLDHQLLVFRGLRLTASDQVEILRAFGPICVEAADGSLHTWVSNERADGRLAERNLPFHSDFFFTAHPHPVLSLYAEHLEGRDVPTDFANAVHACATLPGDLRRRIEGRAQRALTIAVTSFFSHFARSNPEKQVGQKAVRLRELVARIAHFGCHLFHRDALRYWRVGFGRPLK